MNIKLIGHCVQAGVVSSAPGKSVTVVRVHQTNATEEAKAANQELFNSGVPGLLLQLSNVKPEIAAQLTGGPLVEVTVRILPPA